MARQAGASVQNNFSRGLITEATGLNFPENAVIATSNCVFDERGRVHRRLGINFETDFETQSADRTGVVVNSYYWRAAAGNGDNSLLVLQVGDTLYFYLVGSGALSADMIDTLDLTDFSPGGAPAPETTECEFTSGNGYLFVSHPDLEPFYVEYDPDADTVTGNQITVEIRDFEGVDDGLEIDERPLTLSSEHEYNLRNQGWYVIAEVSTSGVTMNVLDRWGDVMSDYPGNNDVWHFYMRADANPPPAESFRPDREGHTHGNSPAPKGHYILPAFQQDRSDVSGVSGIPVLSSGGARPATIAFFAGRVWYSGVQNEEFSSKVYFSQVIETKRQFGYCYQSNDPTERDVFDLLPTDGGVISIQEAGTIIKLWPIGNSLLVFATNGIWGITGSEGLGFRANDYSITKLSSVPALSRSSFVDVGGIPMWWNSDGIYTSSTNQLGEGNIQSVTDQTIRSFYDDIPDDNKRFAKGYFNTRDKIVQWVYRTGSYANLTQAYSYDSVLTLNVLSGAFYPWTIDITDVSINGIVAIEGQGSETATVAVTTNALETITDASLDDVEVLQTTTLSFSAITKFIVSYPNMSSYNFTFAEEVDATLVDWRSFDDEGVNYSSYFDSGYMVHGDAQRKIQANYILLFNETNNEDNQLDFKSKWDYATSGNTGRWSSTQRVTFPSGSYTYRFKRIKTRGHGISLQFRIDSVEGQPFRLIGWSMFSTQNAMI